MGRGKMERNVAFALASIAGTVSKLAFDACMFSSQNFGFVKLPDECTTGSSIMPHKKNPDVFELTRAKCNKIQALPQQIMMIMNNLPSGYFRDLQIIKEVFLPAFQELKDCLQMTTYIMDKIKVNEHILDDDRYLYIFSVEEVNRLAAEGMPFRDAYKKVGLDIEAGKFTHNKQVHHTHEGPLISANNATETTASLLQWTGNAIDLVELIYGIDVMGCINNGNMPLKQLAPLLYKIFGVDSKDCYRFYTDIKRRKNESRTYFIDRMQEKLNERMLRDEELERMRK